MANISDNPLFQAGPTYQAADMRTLIRTQWQFPGVVRGTLNGLAVSQTTPAATMAVNVASGRAVLQDTRATGMSDLFDVTSRANPVTLTIANGDATNSRYDLIVARVRNTEFGDGATQGTIEVVQGTPSGSPIVPATPQGSVALAKVLVTAGNATAIVNANITDVRTYAVRAATATTQVDTTVDPGWDEGTLVFDKNDGKGRVKVNGALTILGGSGGLPVTAEFYGVPNPVVASSTFTASSNTVTTATAHGLSIGDAVFFEGIQGSTGLKDYQPVYVLTTPTSTTLTLSLTSAGSTLALGADGTSRGLRKVSSATLSASLATNGTFTTASPHGMVAGDSVLLGPAWYTAASVTSPLQYWIATTPTSTTFTVTLSQGGAAITAGIGSTVAALPVTKTAGTYTWTCPTSVKTAFATLVGAASGGAGGGASGAGTTTAGSAGGGGGGAGVSGGVLDIGPIATVPGQSYTFVVGRAGLGGPGGVTGVTNGSTGQVATDTKAFGFLAPGASSGSGSGGSTASGSSAAPGGSGGSSNGALDGAAGGGGGGSGAPATAPGSGVADDVTGSSLGQGSVGAGGSGGYWTILAASPGGAGGGGAGTAGSSRTATVLTSSYKTVGGAGGAGGLGGYAPTFSTVGGLYYAGSGGQGGQAGQNATANPSPSAGGSNAAGAGNPGTAGASSATSGAALAAGQGGRGGAAPSVTGYGNGGHGGGGAGGAGMPRNSGTAAPGQPGGPGSMGGGGYVAVSYVLPS